MPETIQPVTKLLPEIDQSEDFTNVLIGLEKQAKNPPGYDPAIGSCYESLLSLMENQTACKEFLSDIYKQRQSFTPGHFINLLFRSVQFIKLYYDNEDHYRYYSSSSDWDDTLNELFNSQKKAILKELLLTKDTVTTKYQRYAGPRALISALWPSNEPLAITDFGCGANYGLRGMELAEPFEPINDQTPGRQFSKLLSTPITISQGLAIDKQNLKDSESRAWSIACSFYPKELDQVGSTNDFEEKLKRSTKTMFLQADLLSKHTVDVVPKGYFHAVLISTLLYQHTLENRLAIINAARKAIRPNGAVIIQDFAQKDASAPDGLSFTEPGSNNYTYRTFLIPSPNSEEILEVFQWSDGRSHIVKAGEDFRKVLGSN